MTRIALYAALSLIGATLLAPAQAAEASRFHASLLVGTSSLDDLSVDAGPINGTVGLDRDVAFGAALGWQWTGPLRLEAEFLSQRADAEDLPALGLTDLSGRVELQTLMVNAVGEWSLADGAIRPYAGLGAGWAMVDIDRIGNNFLQLDGDDDALAWQALVGVAVPVTERLTLTLDARYLRSESVDYAIGPEVAIPASGKIEATRIMAGLRIGF
jgi:opacity protein-like surface antigen